MIKIQDLKKNFGKQTVLNGISFQVDKGEIFGYLGPNGAGKTTTLRILLGLLVPTSGSTLVQGYDLSQNIEIKKKIGVLLESDGLYERLSAWNNLDYYARLYDVSQREQKIENLLKVTALWERKDDPVGKFSRGMRRKLALVRAMIHEPDILFLDEPLSGLDPEAQKMMRELIVHLSQERAMTVFLNSHDLDEVQRMCSKVAVIQGGMIKACDTLKNLERQSAENQVQIVLAGSGDVAPVIVLLNSLNYVSGVIQEDGGLAVSISGKRGSAELLDVLVKKGIKIAEIKNMTRSLEDIYMDIIHQETNA